MSLAPCFLTLLNKIDKGDNCLPALKYIPFSDRRTLFQETVNVHNFKNIPIGKFSRFEKPEPCGRWNGIWDGTVYTRRVRQSTQFEKEIGKGPMIDV